MQNNKKLSTDQRQEILPRINCTKISMSDEDMQNDLRNEVLEAAHTMAYILPLESNDEILNSIVKVAKPSDQYAIDVDTDIMKFDRKSAHSRTYENKSNGRFKQKHNLCFGQTKRTRRELQSFLMTPCSSKEKTVGKKMKFSAAKSPLYEGLYTPSNAESCVNWQCGNAFEDPNHKTKSNLSVPKSLERPTSNAKENKHDSGNEDQSTIKPDRRKDNGENAIYRNLTNTNNANNFVEQGDPSSNKAYNDQSNNINARSKNNTPSYLKQIQMDSIQELRCISKNCCSISAGDGCEGKVEDEKIIHSLLKSSTRSINPHRNQFASQCISSDFSLFNSNAGSQPEDIESRYHNCRLDNGKCKKEPNVVTLSSGFPLGKEGNDRGATSISYDDDYEQSNEGNCINALLTETANRQAKYLAENEGRKKYFITKTQKGHKQRGGARSPKSNVRRRRIEGSNSVSEIMSWASRTVHNGRIYHPEVGYLIHPSYFSNNHGRQMLCIYGKKCSHKPACRDIRALMAARSYMENREHLSYRDIEAVWGVSRSTVQRKTTVLKGMSQAKFDKLYEQIGWKNKKTTQKTNSFNESNKIDNIDKK